MDNKEKIDYTLKVEALKDGTAIDHIPASVGTKVLRMFGLMESGERLYVGLNLPSRRLGKKDLIKVENILRTAEQANQLALFAPNATVNVIENFKVKEKLPLGVPDTVDGMLTCPNSNCITATEPVETSFRVSEKEGEVRLKCKYCEKTFARDAFAQLR